MLSNMNHPPNMTKLTENYINNLKYKNKQTNTLTPGKDEGYLGPVYMEVGDPRYVR